MKIKCIAPVFLLSGYLIAGTIQSDVPCPSNVSLSVYATPDFACRLGGLTFYEFYFDAFVRQGDQQPLNEDQVIVSPFTSIQEAGFTFSGPFTATPGSIIQYHLGWTGDPRPPLIRGFTA